MDNDQIFGIIFLALGTIGIVKYNLDFETAFLFSAASLALFIVGLYLFLRKF